jgi:ATP-dependent 26S proteasome regulatory subunit
MSVSIPKLLQHPILSIRCNPLDREWVVSKILKFLPNTQRWRLHIGIDSISYDSTPFQRMLPAVAQATAGGNYLLDNYLTAIATLVPWERQAIYEQIADLFSRSQSQYQLVLIQTDDCPLPLELARFVYEYQWPYPTTEEITELLQEFNFDITERNLRLATGLAHQDLRSGLTQAVESTEPERCLETYRNARLSLLGVKYDPPPALNEIGGLNLLVEAIEDLKFGFSQTAREIGLPFPKGWLLVGVPGTGKSYSAKCISSTLGYPMLSLEIDKIKVGGITAMARVLEVAQMCAPCVFYMDEIEKLFTREDKPLLSLLLTWLQEKNFPVFVIGTLNRIEDLPVETTRAGRFDRVWEISAPDEESRLKLFVLFLKRFDDRFKVKGDYVFNLFDWQRIVDASTEFVGAEIEQVVINTVLRLKKRDINAEITAADLLESAESFKSMFKRNTKQILQIQNSIEGLADKSNSDDRTILPDRNIDIYAPINTKLGKFQLL